MLQEKQAEEEHMVNMSEKWSMDFFQHQEEWTNSQRGLQKNSLNDCPETWQDIQQDPPLDQMQTELLTLALNSYVPKRSKIQLHLPYNIPSHSGPNLPQKPGPSALNWTRMHAFKHLVYTLHLLYLHLIDWISTVKKKSNSTVVKNQFPQW